MVLEQFREIAAKLGDEIVRSEKTGPTHMLNYRLSPSYAKAQRRSLAPPLDKIAQQHAEREKAIPAAYATGQYSYQEIGDYFGLHFTTVAILFVVQDIDRAVYPDWRELLNFRPGPS